MVLLCRYESKYLVSVFNLKKHPELMYEYNEAWLICQKKFITLKTMETWLNVNKNF